MGGRLTTGEEEEPEDGEEDEPEEGEPQLGVFLNGEAETGELPEEEEWEPEPVSQPLSFLEEELS